MAWPAPAAHGPSGHTDSEHGAGGGWHGESGVPEARTTRARRFPPPSGPRGRARGYGGAHRRTHPAMIAAHAAGALRSSDARPGGDLGDDQEDRVERGMEPDRCPDRVAPEEQPAEREGDRDARREGRRSQAEGLARERSPEIVRTWTTAKNSAPRMSPRQRPMPRTQAVVAKPRNMISSPIGATMAPAIRLTMKPGVSPAGGSGTRRRYRHEPGDDAANGTVATITGIAHSAPKPMSPRVGNRRASDAHRAQRQGAAVDDEEPDRARRRRPPGAAPRRAVRTDHRRGDPDAAPNGSPADDEQHATDRDAGEEHEERRRARVGQGTAGTSLDRLRPAPGDEADR